MNKKYNFYNVLFIFILGTLLHFTYNWSNNNFIVGLFSSTNESIFSHTKLLILPTFIFYILFYKKNKVILNKERKFFYSKLILLKIFKKCVYFLNLDVILKYNGLQQ